MVNQKKYQKKNPIQIFGRC